MKAATRTLIKNSLLLQKGEILNKTNEFRAEQAGLGVSYSDESEQISADLANNVAIHLHERDSQQLMAIERALAKIENGIFGECEACGGEIGESRLRARPFASLCIECMEEREESRPLPN